MALQFQPPPTPNMLQMVRNPAGVYEAANQVPLPLPFPDAGLPQSQVDGGQQAAAPPQSIPRPQQTVPASTVAPPTESSQLAAQLQKLNAPPTTKQSILDAVLKFAPAAVAGAFGGLPAAAGAAQGVVAGTALQTAERDRQQQSLIEQVQAARQREQQQGQFNATLTENKAKLAQENTIAAQNDTRLRNLAADVQAGNTARNNATIAARPKPNIDPRSQEGIAAAIEEEKQKRLLPLPPQQPLRPPALLPPENEAQQIRIHTAEQKPTADQTVVQAVDDPNNPGKQMLVVVDKNNRTSSPVAGPASKTSTAQNNTTAKSADAYKAAQRSYAALEGLSKNQTSASDQAMVTQFFDIIKPGSGARMNEAEIARLVGVGDLPSRAQVWFQKASTREAFTPAIRQEILQAARTVVDSKNPGSRAGGNEAPEGTVITNGTQKLVKRGGQWVKQ